MSVSEPGIMFRRPFAESGDKTILPDSAAPIGRASLLDGFPRETEKPLVSGGFPPHRLDFNGVLYMLSAYAHWYQSGGMWKYNQTLDYAVPCMVYHNDEFWLCTAENGAGTSAGVRQPATGSLYWRRVWQELTLPNGGMVHFAKGYPSGISSPDGDLCVSYDESGAVKQALYEKVSGSWVRRIDLTRPNGGMVHFVQDYPSGIDSTDGDLCISYSTMLGTADTAIHRGVYEKVSGSWVMRINLLETLVSKVGEIAFFARNTPPQGWLECNGANLNRSVYSTLFNVIGTTFGYYSSTTFKIPDLRGQFIRGWDNGVGIDNGRVFGSTQGDAIRNITGSFDIRSTSGSGGNITILNSSGAMSETTDGLASLGTYSPGGTTRSRNRVTFSAAEVVPTSNENRPRNTALLAAIRYI